MRRSGPGTGGVGGARGFTLLEVVLVLVLIGLIAAAGGVGLVSGTERVRRNRATAGVIEELAIARVEAMRSGRPVVVEARVDAREERLVVVRAGRERSWPAAGLRPVLEPGRAGAGLSVRFAPTGRADVGEWRFAPAGVPAGGAGRIVVIEFDAVSGSPVLVRG